MEPFLQPSKCDLETLFYRGAELTKEPLKDSGGFINMNRIGFVLLGVTLFAASAAAQSQTGAQAGAQTNAQANAQASKQGAQASGNGTTASSAAAQTGHGNAALANGST